MSSVISGRVRPCDDRCKDAFWATQAGPEARLRGGRLGVGGAQSASPAHEEGRDGKQEGTRTGHDSHADAGIAEVEAVVPGRPANGADLDRG